MTFKRGKQSGKLWADLQNVTHYIEQANCNNTSNTERQFENLIYGCLDANRNHLNHEVIFQRNTNQSVNSAEFFGKNHRPDMSIDSDGVAIELKFVNSSLDSVRTAIGQGFIYRKSYKFVMLVLVLSKDHEELFNHAYDNNLAKSDTDNLFHKLADDNIFTILKAGFSVRKGIGDTVTYPRDLKSL